MADSSLNVRSDGVLHKQVPSGFFPHRFEVVGNVEAGEIGGQSLGRDVLEIESVQRCGLAGSGNGRSFGVSGQQQATAVDQQLAAVGCQLVPEPVRIEQQRNVVGVFEVGLPDDSGVAVRTATVMGDAEPLDAQHARPAGRDVVKRGAAETTDSDYHAVECRAHLPAARLTRTSSLSFRAKTLLSAKAGCDQMVIRRLTFRVGSTSFARLISW